MPIHCPIGCGAVIDEREAQSHLESTCPRVPILCPYGCQQSFRREQLGEHGITCPVISQLKPGTMVMQDTSVQPESKNAIDAIGHWMKSLFTKQRHTSSASAPDAGVSVQAAGDDGSKGGPVTYSAVPARLQDRPSSSAPPSPGLKRSNGGGSSLSIPSSSSHQRVSSAPSPPPKGLLQASGSQPIIYAPNSTPPIFGFLIPFVEQFSPAITPYVDKAQVLYQEFKNSDEKSHYIWHICILVVLLYFLSSLLIFAFKLFVFTTLMFSTGWTVHTAEWFSSSEMAKRYAFAATGLIGVYLFILMN